MSDVSHTSVPFGSILVTLAEFSMIHLSISDCFNIYVAE